MGDQISQNTEGSNYKLFERQMPMIQTLKKDLIKAIGEHFESDVFIMSGAAGTGKTSVTKAIIKILSDRKINIRICAPTNRAAKVIKILYPRVLWSPAGNWASYSAKIRFAWSREIKSRSTQRNASEASSLFNKRMSFKGGT